MAIINGGDGPDILNGGDEDDVINGFGGNDTIAGGVGNDVINPGTGLDTVDGGPGDDRLIYDAARVGNGGRGVWDGGAGVDTFDASALGRGLTMSTPISGRPGVTTFFLSDVEARNIERVIGTNSADELGFRYSSLNMTLLGGGGDDYIVTSYGTTGRKAAPATIAS
jgi:Ca2+-binding RTX toxin-like protein